MRNASNFLLFHVFWLVAVGGASHGRLWLGPAAAAVILVVHLGMIRGSGERLRELRYVLLVGAIGTVLDSGMRAAGAIVYPTSEAWRLAMPPPFITSLWVAFGMLPRFSLSWLTGRPLLTALLGSVGGVLSFHAGTRFGVVAVGPSAVLTWGTLALEYAIVTPLLLQMAPHAGRRVVGASSR